MASTYNGTPGDSRFYNLKHQIETIWNLPIPVRDNLQHHFILYWSPEHYSSQLEPEGTIYKEGRTFKVVYYKCTPDDCKRDTLAQVALSFRVPLHTRRQEDVTLQPIVLVSCLPSATYKQRQLTHRMKSGKISEVSHIKTIKPTGKVI